MSSLVTNRSPPIVALPPASMATGSPLIEKTVASWPVLTPATVPLPLMRMRPLDAMP